MNYLNPHKLVISGGAAKLQTNPAKQLQNQGLAMAPQVAPTEAFDLLSKAQNLTIGTPSEEDFTYEDLLQ